jgi:hypothetical protein
MRNTVRAIRNRFRFQNFPSLPQRMEVSEKGDIRFLMSKLWVSFRRIRRPIHFEFLFGSQVIATNLTPNLESPIIRISPQELHVNDPDFYDVLFAGSHTKRDKPPTWSHAFSNIDSVFGTISHEKHRARRSALNPLFSQSSLRKLEPLIQDKIDRLVSVFRRYQQTGEVLPLRAAFAALTSDIIADYCFGASENYIEAPGFNAVVLETTDSLTENMHITVQFQWLPRLMDSLPDKVVEGMLGEGMSKFNELKRVSVSASRSHVEILLTAI